MASGTTPFPNFLLDRVMPRLKDTEWRVLCVIVRQTLGWQLESGARKSADWLSHSQLKRRTGRASAAISQAIEMLVQSGLITVRDFSGQSVVSSAERRRSHHRLCFSLHPRVLSTRFQRGSLDFGFRSSESENNKRNPHKRKIQQQRFLAG
ncbi:MAG: replication protein [Fimbriimonadaceae bacterium]|nr:replication protein [Fimbriimonadaceae bacterium]